MPRSRLRGVLRPRSASGASRRCPTSREGPLTEASGLSALVAGTHPHAHSRPLPTARAFKSDHQVGASQGNGKDPRPSLVLGAEIERDSSSQSDAVRRTRLQTFDSDARIVSRYNQRARQVGFEDEAPWRTLRLQRRESVEAYQTTMDVPGANLDSVWS